MLERPYSIERHYSAVRAATEVLCAPLQVEDHLVQSMPEASPAKWHSLPGELVR